MEDSQFSSLYKYKTKSLTIQEKRENFLQQQKEKRHNAVDKNRESFEKFLKENSKNESEIEEMECCETEKKPFQFSLMLTDWFTEVPEDFETNWLVKAAPEGLRVMMVARNRRSVFYNEKGRLVLSIKSNFPSGGGCDHSSGITILDCILNFETKTVFILDCLCWNNMPMIYSEARFRFFWIHSKFEECPKLKECLRFHFVEIKAFPALRDLIQDKLSDVLTVNDKKYYYEGIVFYHQESEYTLGYSPLVGWLASFMLPEILNIDVNYQNLKRKPDNYVNILDYIENYHKMKKKGYRN